MNYTHNQQPKDNKGRFQSSKVLQPTIESNAEFINRVRNEIIEGYNNREEIEKAYNLLGYTNPMNIQGMKRVVVNTGI